MTCQKAQGYLEKHQVKVADQEDANKKRRGRAEALELAHSVNRIIAAKGKKIVTFDMKKGPPDEETLLAHLLGPTGNLRAPTARVGRTLLVGFSEKAYSEIGGKRP